jgi:hypothetical protein
MLATAPPPPFFPRIGANACVTASAPRTLTSYSCRPASSQASSVNGAPNLATMPALLTSSVTSDACAAAAIGAGDRHAPRRPTLHLRRGSAGAPRGLCG